MLNVETVGVHWNVVSVLNVNESLKRKLLDGKSTLNFFSFLNPLTIKLSMYLLFATFTAAFLMIELNI